MVEYHPDAEYRPEGTDEIKPKKPTFIGKLRKFISNRVSATTNAESEQSQQEALPENIIQLSGIKRGEPITATLKFVKVHGGIDITFPPDTHYIELKITFDSPEEAERIFERLRNVSHKDRQEIINAITYSPEEDEELSQQSPTTKVIEIFLLRKFPAGK